MPPRGPHRPSDFAVVEDGFASPTLRQTLLEGEESARMRHRDERAELRGVVYRGDGGSFVTMLTREAWPDHALQLIGDGLLGVLAAWADGVAELARRCVIGLRERGWEGDGELVGVLEGDPVTGGGRIDLRTGEVWPQPAIEYAEETGDFDADDRSGGCGSSVKGPARGTATRSFSLPRRGHRSGGPAQHCHRRAGRVPPVQGRVVAMARTARPVVRLQRGPPAGSGSSVAGRKGYTPAPHRPGA